MKFTGIDVDSTYCFFLSVQCLFCSHGYSTDNQLKNIPYLDSYQYQNQSEYFYGTINIFNGYPAPNRA